MARMALEKPAFNGRQKAAILCLALGAEHAAKLTQKLSADEAELISLEIARMGRIEPEAAEIVLVEWIELAVASEAISTGGVEYAREVLEKAFNVQKAQSILKRVTSHLADSAGLQRLRHVDAKQVANMFRNEHPQTVALILAHLATPQAAAVLKELDTDASGDIAYRMARMQKVSPDMIELIERSLGSDADLDLQRGMATAGGPAAVAAMLNLLQGVLEKSILEKVADQDPALSEQIKNLMFVFEDLRGLDDRALQRLLRDVDTKNLALALKAASIELRDRITEQMSQRAANALREEMEMLGPARMRDVEAAQAAVVAQARALEATGEIVLTGGGDDVVVG
ncbi:MAG TPA: flagellar motor switch protein FliG [Gemmatimonadaceae bacterium]|nr:flagellar motor switch protein FliG [Gemmatimonadaceae bacterium]